MASPSESEPGSVRTYPTGKLSCHRIRTQAGLLRKQHKLKICTVIWMNQTRPRNTELMCKNISLIGSYLYHSISCGFISPSAEKLQELTLPSWPLCRVVPPWDRNPPACRSQSFSVLSHDAVHRKCPFLVKQQSETTLPWLLRKEQKQHKEKKL